MQKPREVAPPQLIIRIHILFSFFSFLSLLSRQSTLTSTAVVPTASTLARFGHSTFQVIRRPLLRRAPLQLRQLRRRRAAAAAARALPRLLSTAATTAALGATARKQLDRVGGEVANSERALVLQLLVRGARAGQAQERLDTTLLCDLLVALEVVSKLQQCEASVVARLRVHRHHRDERAQRTSLDETHLEWTEVSKERSK